MANAYYKGANVRLSASFTDIAGNPVDPGGVFFQHKDPAGVTVTKQYGVDPEVVRDSAGKYHMDVTADQSDDWWYRIYSTGTAMSAQEETFTIHISRF